MISSLFWFLISLGLEACLFSIVLKGWIKMENTSPLQGGFKAMDIFLFLDVWQLLIMGLMTKPIIYAHKKSERNAAEQI